MKKNRDFARFKFDCLLADVVFCVEYDSGCIRYYVDTHRVDLFVTKCVLGGVIYNSTVKYFVRDIFAKRAHPRQYWFVVVICNYRPICVVRGMYYSSMFRQQLRLQLEVEAWTGNYFLQITRFFAALMEPRLDMVTWVTGESLCLSWDNQCLFCP